MGDACCVRPRKSKVVVVSNYLPADDPRPGDYLSAVVSAVVENAGLWIGGFKVPEPVGNFNASSKQRIPTDQVHVVDIANHSQSIDKYRKFCRNLWLLLHSNLETEFSLESWLAYQEVNSIFALKTVETVEKLSKDEKDTQIVVWLQDFHLMLAANSIRTLAAERGLAVKIGFFLHTPFPARDVFKLFPWSEETLQGLLVCDVVGFNTETYCSNFIESCYQRLGCRVDKTNGLVEHGNRACKIRALPIGIPFEQVEKLSESRSIDSGEKSRQLILSFHTSEPTSFLVQRLKAVEALIEEYPKLAGKVQLRLFADSESDDGSKKSSDERAALVTEINTRINQLTKLPSWSLIELSVGNRSRDEVVTYYKSASVAFLGPLRDGMNIVAKEFVASQSNSDPGVLVVSQFSGAVETMKEALIYNPNHINETAEILHKALTMPVNERTVRMNFLRRRETANNSQAWFQSFLRAFGSQKETKSSIEPVSINEIDKYMSNYVGTINKLALLLDYDGTLAPICAHPDLAVLPAETRKVLESLAKMPQLFIAIISGRNVYNVKQMVGIEGITYAGNHGLEIVFPNGEKYVHHVPVEFENRAKQLINELKEKVCRSGAWVEPKGALMTFHYRDTPVAERAAIVAEANALMKKAGFKANPAHCAIEAKPPVEWNKGRAAVHILCKEFGMDWADKVRVVFAGDDRTDEDAMEVLKGMAATFRIAPPQITKSFAEYRLPSIHAVVTLLQWIERHYSAKK